MSSAISYLRVTRGKPRNGAIRYRYTLCDLPDTPSYDQIRNQQSRDKLESNLRNAAERLRQTHDAGPRVDGEFTFADLGDILARYYLPPDVVDYLFRSTTPLVVETNDPEVPWEIVLFQGQTLGAYRPVSRTVHARQATPAGTARWGQQRHALIIGDTLGKSPASDHEARELDTTLKGYRDPYDTVTLRGSDGTKHAISSLLQHGVEFLHLAGHVTYDKQHRKESAIICANNEPLTITDIRSLRGTYAFVFIDGCNGGRAAQSSGDGPSATYNAVGDIADYLLSSGGRDVEGLAIPFLEGGASIFISTLWRVRDTSAYRFAHAFYQQALQGMAIGEALRRVKETWLREHPDDPSWAAYILYGNPLLTLDTVRDPERLDAPATRTVSRYNLVSIPQRDFAAGGIFRNARAEQFFRRFAPDPELTLSDEARRILEETLSWVDRMNWSMITRFDFLVGMARVKGGMVERGLAALGSSTEALCELNVEKFGHGKRRADQPIVSSGVFAAIMRAVGKSAKRDSTTISEDDMVSALLDLPPTGSVRVVFQSLRIDDGQTLLAAARGELSATPPAAQRPPRVSSGALLVSPRRNTKIDVTPRSMLRDLRAEITNAQPLDAIPPFVGREDELFELLRALSSTDDVPHVVVYGPPGVGSRALAYHLAARLVFHPEASETAAIANWDLMALRLTRDSQKISEWLPNEVQELPNPTIILLEDLPALLSYEGVAETIHAMQRHPNLRLLATAHTDDYRLVRRQFAGIAELFTPTLLDPPREDEALRMVEAHLPSLERHFQLRIAPEAPRAALAIWRAESPLVLPGAALTRLERACARKVNRGAPQVSDESAEPQENLGELPGVPPVPGQNVALSTRPSAAPLTVTAQDVHEATPLM
jgi:hypothetical protein